MSRSRKLVANLQNFDPREIKLDHAVQHLHRITVAVAAAMERITAAPSVIDDFTPLFEHQAQTPGTFFGAKPVLHLHAISAISAADHPDLRRLETPVDTYVTSRTLILWSSSQSLGFHIPYPAITVTAQDGADVLLEINLSDENTADEDIEFVQLRITPERIEEIQVEEQQAEAGAGAGATNGTTSSNDKSTALFKAISDCQELNPDPQGDDEYGEGEGEGEGAFDETAPGATGWITSENMADFIDENGNFRMPEGVTVVGDEATLGAGAGTTRTAAEANDEDEEESKWQRTG